MKYIAILAVVALVVLAACQPMVIQQQQPTPDKKQITVSSDAELKDQADQVEIFLGVQSTAPDAQTSQRTDAEVMDKVVSAIKAVGLSDNEISTAGFNVYPNTQWDPMNQKSIDNGYTTQNTVQIKTTKIDLAGQILDAAAKAGANQVNSVQFSLTKDKEDKLKVDALRQATSDAKVKAQAIADGLGVQLGTVASVNENQVYFPPIYASGYASAVDMKAAAPTPLPPISGGEISVTATVSVVYNIA